MNITQINKKLSSLYSDLISYNEDNIKIIDTSMLNLEKIILNENLSLEEEQKITTFMERNGMLSTFQKSYEIFETNLERRFAKYMIQEDVNTRENFKKYLLYGRFVTLLTNEINLAHISRDDKVLFIGSGPIPITAILIHKLTQSKIDCVEKNKISAELSKKVIKRLNYCDFIRVINKEGVEVDCSSYSVILVALLARPKDLLLKSIWNKTNKRTRIICRTSDLSKQAFYEKTAEKLLDKYRPINKIIAKGDQTISSVLLIKNNNIFIK